jgi:hypothetical protein
MLTEALESYFVTALEGLYRCRLCASAGSREVYNACAMSTSRRLATAVASGVSVGILATLTMDGVLVLMSQLGGEALTSEKAGPEFIGRWAGNLLRGRCRHPDIAKEPPLRGEAAIGLATHYLTGIALSGCYLTTLRQLGLRPDPLKAIAFGGATALLPLLILYPSWGYGWFGLRSDEASRMVRIMLLGHLAFGVGIGLWTALLLKPKAD